MADYILIEGDDALFDSAFAGASVTVRPGKLVGSGPATIDGKKICVQGDETKVIVEGCPYSTPAHPTLGVGTLTIFALAANQKATKTNSGNKPVLLRGNQFTAQFQVKSAAKQAAPANTPDPLTVYFGTGSFNTKNSLFQGT
jgi:hypothetical protein